MNNPSSSGAVTGMEIAVIGMSGRFPGAKNIAEFWDNLIMGVESLSFFSYEEVEAPGVAPELVKSPSYVKTWMTLEGIEYFDSVFFNYTPREAELMEPQMRLFHECAWEVLEDAGYDPGSYSGKIGIISGASSSAYWEAMSFLGGNVGWGEAMLANKDFIGARIAYKLNLTGPSSTVQTACSTSMVGIHQACRALLTGECKMMIVGGVGMYLPQKQGYMYQEGMILAPDGRCRAFDADALGTIGGNGIGVILLKRLKHALEDRDYIYGVIKSTAVNNDGSKKVGFTAPAVEGQAAVIRTAIRMAKVDSESILYIETHGTGTPLGDSIEIDALKKAFDTRKKGYCALGAVKTNIGHLDAASGIAGIIKTLLVLKHRLIVPNLNFKVPNPILNLVDSPFYVNTVCTPLEAGKTPLRAGVSSFGIGGTNVHAILEEAPQREPSLNGGDYHLLLFSALSEPALNIQVKNFVDYLKKNPGVNLADAAYTLQVGRKFFKHRRIAVCANTAAAVTILSAPADPPFINGGSLPLTDESGTELFKYDGKGADTEATLEKAGNLWLQGCDIDWSGFYSEEKRFRIPLPTYPFQRQRYWKDAIIGGFPQDIIMPTLQAVPSTQLPYSLTPEEWENITQMEQELHEELKIKGISGYGGLEATVDRLCASYIFYFLEECGLNTEKGQTYTLENVTARIKLLPKFEKFFAFFIDVLVQDRILAVNGNHIRFLTGKEQVPPPGKLKQEAQEKYPGFKGFFQLLEYCVSHYKEALSGEIEAIEVLFPGGKAAADRQAFQIGVEYSNLRIYCHLLEKITSKIIDQLPAGKKWRILEVGAGTGTLTKFLVPVLKKMNREIEYHFTDIGNFFVTGAKNEPSFENLDFLSYGILDISKDPVLQGYQAGYFDMVLGFNVVHAVPYIKQALANLEELLAAGGIIALIETVRSYRWINMIDGLAEGWWYFRDEEIRKTSPLLDLNGWKEVFNGQGFVEVKTFPRDGARRLESDIGLIVACRASRGAKIKEEPVQPAAWEYERSHIRTPYVPPGNELEEKLAGIYQEALGMKKVGAADDFFQLKVDSLMAISITARIHKEFGVRIPLPLFFEKATISSVADYIHDARQEVYISLEPVEEKEYYPLSPSQRRLYVLQQLDPETVGFNIPYALTVEGEVKGEKLAEIFKILGTRHESFRTSFIICGDEPVQRIHRDKEFNIEYYESREGKDPDSIIQGFVRSFEMSRGPLLRVGMMTLPTTAAIIMIDMHHIIADGTSLSIFIREFTTLVAGQGLTALKVQYKDYSEWQRQRNKAGTLEKQQEFWLGEYEGEIPVCDFPTDYPRPSLQSYEGASYTFAIAEKETGVLKLLVLEEETTLFSVLLALFNVFVYKMSGNNDIVIGTSVVGRRVVDVEQTIGIFINTLALRNRLTGSQTFKVFLKSLGKKVLQAFENQEYPFAELVEKVVVNRDMSRNPLFDINFILQNMEDPEIEIEGLKLKSYPLEHRTAQIDLNIFAVERKGKIEFNIEYSTKLFKESTILRYIAYFRRILQAVIRDRDMLAARIDILSAEERHRLLFEFNNTRQDIPRDKSYHSLWEDSVSLNEDRVSVLHHNHYFSGRQLNEASNRLGHFLLDIGSQPSDIVCLYMERGISLLVSILGAYKAGAAYLPIETDYPLNRVRYMLKNSNAAVIVTEPANLEVIAGMTGELPRLKTILCMDGEGSCRHLQPYPVHNPGREYNPENLAYLMYTSGTTGEPKGVMIQQKGMINHMYAKMRYFAMTDRDVLPQTGPACFDISVWQLLAPLLLGSFTFIIDTVVFLDPPIFLSILQRERVSILEFVPPWLTAFLEVIQSEENRSLARIRYMVSTGDVLPVSLVRNWYKMYPGIKIVNTYGPTEASDDIAHYTVDTFPREDQLTIPVGKPLDNLHIYILDKDLNLCPTGVRGEICVAGLGVGSGYWQDEEKTARSFIPNPFVSEIGDPDYARMYKMGDIGYRREDGNVECLGRRDLQVKIKSHRIELGEIENHLLKHPLIKEAVVIARDLNVPHRETYLCAYIVPLEPIDSPAAVNEQALREYLSLELPAYMVPRFFIMLEAIPVTPNGKIDRKALPEPGDLDIEENYTPPRDEVERTLVETWAEVLGMEKAVIGIDNNFFTLGGHSFSATVMAAKIHKQLMVKLPLAEIFRTPYIRNLAQAIKGMAKDIYKSIEPVESREFYPLAPAQKRLYFLQQLNPGSTTYNLAKVMVMEGEPERQRMEAAFRATIQRHESLRTSFELLGGDPYQIIHPHVDFNTVNLEMKEDEVSSYIQQQFLQPFDLSRAPLLRVAMLRTGEQRYLLVVDIHHIISDGISWQIMQQEFAAFYAGETLPPLLLQYKDFSQWQNRPEHSEKISEQKRYWIGEFADEPPLLNLPLDFPRFNAEQEPQAYQGEWLNFEISTEQRTGLKKIAHDEETTLFMILLTIYYIFLVKMGDQQDIVIGVPVAGRRHDAMMSIIGIFINTLPIRIRSKKEETFGQLLARVKEISLAAFENQDCPLEEIVVETVTHREPYRNPLFDVMFVFWDIGINPSPGKQNQPLINIKEEENGFQLSGITTAFDITLYVQEEANRLYFNMEYPRHWYKKSTIKGFVTYFKEILKAVLENRNIPINDIAISHQLLSTRKEQHPEIKFEF